MTPPLPPPKQKKQKNKPFPKMSAHQSSIYENREAN